jgi:hypothetical protein
MNTRSACTGRTARTIALFAALLAAGLSCGKKDPGVYSGKDGSFAVKFPAGWELRENESGVTVIASDTSSQSLFRPNAIVATETVPDSQGLRAYFGVNMDSIRSVLNGFTVIAESEARAGGAKAIRSEYAYTLGPVKVHVMSMYVIKGGRAFVLNCSGMDDDYEVLKPVFEGIISSFVPD